MTINGARWRWLIRPLAKLLCLLVVLAPATVTTVEAQETLPPIGADPGPVPVPPTPGTAEATYLSYGSGLGVEAENGFVVSLANGEWRHDGHAHVGGTGSIASPWGEEMSLRYWINSDGSFAIEYDGSATLHYVLDELGQLTYVLSVTDEGVKEAFVRDRVQRLGLGGVDLWIQDVEPYRAVLAQIARSHSPEFLSGAEVLQRKLESTRLVVPAGCTTSVLECTAAVIGWIATVPGIAAGCTVGSTITLGAACLAAILGHEAASVAAVAVCVSAIENCTDHSGDSDPGGGCSGPGGTTE